MKSSRFSEEQIAYVLRQVDSGTPVADVCRSVGISEATFYVWKKNYASLDVSLNSTSCGSSRMRTRDLKGSWPTSRSTSICELRARVSAGQHEQSGLVSQEYCGRPKRVAQASNASWKRPIS